MLQIVLNNNIYSDNSNDKGVFPTHNPQPSTPNRVNIEIIHEPPTNISPNNEVYETNPLSSHSYDSPNDINDLILAELCDMDFFDDIDMVPNHENTQDINNIGTIMKDVNELIPIIPFDTTLMEEEQNLKEIDEAVTIKHLLSSTNGGDKVFIDNTEVMDHLFNTTPISPPSQFKDNSEP